MTGTDTTASVQAATADIAAASGAKPDEITDAVLASQAASAPSDPVQQFLVSLHARVAQIESVLGLVAPVVNEVAGVVGAFVPGAAPVLSRLGEIECAVGGIIASLGSHFGGKIAMPAAPGTPQA